MLRDITIGQFFPGDSIIHRLDPRFKIVITLIYIILKGSGFRQTLIQSFSKSIFD